ncbi:MAG: ABC transporter permease [Alphaproteobacteria bacterium]|nr:ABC transporter permease [Alphaproteobacteria bacterium]
MTTVTASAKTPAPLIRLPTRFTTGSVQLNIGVVILTTIAMALLLQEVLVTSAMLDGNLSQRLRGPSWWDTNRGNGLMGTDQLGRDLFFRVLAGFPWSLGISGIAVCMVALIGTFIGLVGAWSTGFSRTIVLLGISSIISMPFLVLALVVIALIGRGFWPLTLTMGFIAWPAIARVIYAESRGLLMREYVLAARLFGVSKWAILFGHVLPGLRPTILVMAAFFFAVLLIIESALSFLGLGAPLNAPSWGNMLSDSRQYLVNAPWMMFVPAGAICSTVISLNLIGDGVAELSRRRARAVEV